MSGPQTDPANKVSEGEREKKAPEREETSTEPLVRGLTLIA